MHDGNNGSNRLTRLFSMHMGHFASLAPHEELNRGGELPWLSKQYIMAHVEHYMLPRNADAPHRSHHPALMALEGQHLIKATGDIVHLHQSSRGSGNDLCLWQRCQELVGNWRIEGRERLRRELRPETLGIVRGKRRRIDAA